MRSFCLSILVAAWLSGCGERTADLATHDEIFVSSDDHGVLCAALGDDAYFSLESVLSAFDRARREQRIVQVFFHVPNVTISPAKLDAVLAGATERGLRFVTYRELASGAPPGPGVALSIDDWQTDQWVTQRPLFKKYAARITFFVSDYDAFTAQQKLDLRALSDDGHDIEYHSTRHQDAPRYVAEHAMGQYLANDIQPAYEAMVADGYDPIVFAWPLGRRTDELDAELLRHFELLRSTSVECPH